jgi:hypothetical protein
VPCTLKKTRAGLFLAKDQSGSAALSALTAQKPRMTRRGGFWQLNQLLNFECVILRPGAPRPVEGTLFSRSPPALRAPRRCQRRDMMSENLGLTSHKSSCNCTGCGMLRAGVCINCAEKTAALIFESGPEEIAVEPCSGACREAIELYFSTPPERWRAPLTR